MMKRPYLLLLLWPIAAQAQPTPYQWHLQTGLAVVPPAAFRPAMTYDPVRRIALCIVPANSGDFQGTWRGDGIGWTPPTDASSTERRNEVQVVFDTVRGVAVLYCQSGDGLVSDTLKPGITWEWNGSLWRLASTNGPQNRDDMGMAFGFDC